MKVAIDGRALTEGRQSGVQEYVRHLLWALEERKGDDSLEVFVSGWQVGLHEELPPGLTLSVWQWPNKVLTSSQWLLSWPKWDSLIEADVFLAPNLQLLPLKSTTPLVAVAHDLSFEQFPEFLTARRRLWHRMVGPQRFFKRANRIVAVSEHTKSDLEEWYGLDQEKIDVVYPGVAGPSWEPSEGEVAAMRSRYGLPERYVLYLGAMEPRKNIEGVVRAFEEIAGRHPHGLVLAGELGWREDQIEAAVRQSQVHDRIYRLGVVSESDKWLLYAGADVFVYPSFYEGFGFPPLEALWCGTPVIVSVSSSLPEVVGDWAVMVNPEAHGQLALALEEIFAAGRKRIDRSVRDMIKKRYNWGQAAEQIWRILRNLS